MTSSAKNSRATLFRAALAGIALLANSLSGQTAPDVGSIQGRVQNTARGDYLNNALVTVEGTTLSALTNQFGEYRIANVPAGEVKVTAFYSGLPPETVAVSVRPGATVTRDFDLRSGATGDTVVLEALTVSTSRQMTAAAIATNEQRFAPNMKTVLSSDSFGDQSEGNVAEFLKLMPAIAIDYVEADARNASIRGLPAFTTMVTRNGNQIASAASSGASRVFEFEQVSINDLARIEINKSLLPDMPAEGIGGTINLITKRSFERTRPQLDYRGHVNFNSTKLQLGRTPGPGREPTHKLKPGFDLTYIRPVNKNFGFSVSASSSSKYNPQYFADPTWNLNANAAGAENPFLASFNLQDGPKYTNRYSGSVTIDWRFAPHDVLELGFSEQYYGAMTTNRNLTVNAGTNPASFGPAFTQGRANAGSGSFQASMREKTGTTWTPEFRYTHHGPLWKWEANGAYSHSSNHYRDIDNGHFANFSLTMGAFNPAGTNVAPTIRFDNTGNYLPNVTAVNGLGATVSAFDVNNYVLANANGSKRDSADVKKTLGFKLARTFGREVPLTIKLGGDVRQSIRDIRRTDYTYTFVGPDGRTGTPDNAAATLGIVDERYSSVAPPFALPRFQWPDNYKLWDLYVAHPNWWTTDPGAIRNSGVANSRFADETITSGFVRLDTALFRNRLHFAGGVRFQRYTLFGESGLVDTLGRYAHDSEGNLVINPATGQPIVLTGTTLEVSERTNVDRGIKTRGKFNGFYPSLNASYRITDNLQFRAAFGQSVNYPDLRDVVGNAAVTDITANPRRLTANAPLEPWTARNYDLDLEYYTPTGGAFTLSWFRKDISNFVNQVRHQAGTAAASAALQRHGYGALFPLNYEVLEKYNGGAASFDGWEFGAQQSLHPYVPDWARGFTVFFNTSYKAAPSGANAADIEAASKRRMNWGVSFQRAGFAANLKWNHVPEVKYTRPINQHDNSKTYLDADVSYRLRRSLSLFASATNVFNVPQARYIYTVNTPDYARRRQYHYFGVQCVAGIKGQF